MFICITMLACGNQNDVTGNDDSKVLATIGGDSVTEAYLAAFLNSKDLSQLSEQQKKQGLDALINQLSLANQAAKDGLTMTQQQVFEIELAKQRILAQLAIEQHLAANPISEDDIQAEYKRITGELKGEEYHVRHLLFQDEVQALQTLDQITTGADYVAVESVYLRENAQVKNVGDIGWVNIMQVPEVFRSPLQSMPPGSVHPKTLVSQFGVHILYLENKRPLHIPELEKVEAGIRKTLTQKKISRFEQLSVIKAKAKIVK